MTRASTYSPADDAQIRILAARGEVSLTDAATIMGRSSSAIGSRAKLIGAAWVNSTRAQGSTWTAEDDAMLRALAPDGDVSQVQAAERMGRSIHAVGRRCSDLRIKWNTKPRIGNLKPQLSDWTPDMDAELRRRVALAHDFADIGKLLGKSKSACIGRAGRLGLKMPPKPSVGRGKVAKPKPPVMAVSRPVVVIPPPPPSVTDIARITETRRRCCSWPIGTPGTNGFGFCGLPAERTYCPAHAARAVDHTRKPLNVRSTVRFAEGLGRVVRKNLEGSW